MFLIYIFDKTVMLAPKENFYDRHTLLDTYNAGVERSEIGHG